MSPRLYVWDGALDVLDADAVKHSAGICEVMRLSECRGLISQEHPPALHQDPEDCLFMWNSGKEEILAEVICFGFWWLNFQRKYKTAWQAPKAQHLETRVHKHTRVCKYENNEGSSCVGGGGETRLSLRHSR